MYSFDDIICFVLYWIIKKYIFVLNIFSLIRKQHSKLKFITYLKIIIFILFLPFFNDF